MSRREGGTRNLEAYQLYLRAESANFQNTRSSLDAAGEYLEQAIRLTLNMGWHGHSFPKFLPTKRTKASWA